MDRTWMFVFWALAMSENRFKSTLFALLCSLCFSSSLHCWSHRSLSGVLMDVARLPSRSLLNSVLASTLLATSFLLLCHFVRLATGKEGMCLCCVLATVQFWRCFWLLMVVGTQLPGALPPPSELEWDCERPTTVFSTQHWPSGK